jgi:hypothetical protein
VQEREGLITTLGPIEPPARDAQQVALRERNAKVLTAFRKDLLRRGLSPQTVEGHVSAIRAFAEGDLLPQDPPRGLLTITPADVRRYLRMAAANPISARHFFRFLGQTDRLHPAVVADFVAVLKPT